MNHDPDRPAPGERDPNHRWALTLAELDDETFVALLEEVFAEIYQRYFADELLLVNHALPIVTRAWRRTGPWRIGLILTPWMLARVYSPMRHPDIALPAGWSAVERAHALYEVIGPSISFSILDVVQKAHLNYHDRLGHYLLQPLVQSLENYASAEAVYAAWDAVIRTRDEAIKRLNKQSQWQEEVSRRELFTRLMRRGSGA